MATSVNVNVDEIAEDVGYNTNTNKLPHQNCTNCWYCAEKCNYFNNPPQSDEKDNRWCNCCLQSHFCGMMEDGFTLYQQHPGKHPGKHPEEKR